MRRRQGTGTIEKRRMRDGSIRFMPRLPDEPRTPLGTYPTYEEAESLLDASVYLLKKGELKTSKTLAAYGRAVFDRRELAGHRNTDDDRRRWKYVEGNPKLGRKPWRCHDWPLDAIRRKDVKAWTLELLEHGISFRTRVNALALLRAVFASALDDELVQSNPAADVHIKNPGRTEPEMRPLTLEQLSALFWAADDEGRFLIAIAVGTCLRNSELRMLRYEDVHLSDPRPHLTVCRGKRGKSPKNGKIRRVPLFGLALAAFQVWKPPPNDRGLYFAKAPSTSKKSSKMGIGTLRHPSKIIAREKWLAWLDAAGIDRRVRWHDLRHTGATLLLLGELAPEPWTLEELCDFLGHSTIAMTEKYARFLNLKAEKAARRSHTEATRHSTARVTVEDRTEKNGAFERDTGFEALRVSSDLTGLDRARRHARGVLEAIAAKDPFAWQRAIDLAEAVLDIPEAVPRLVKDTA